MSTPDKYPPDCKYLDENVNVSALVQCSHLTLFQAVPSSRQMVDVMILQQRYNLSYDKFYVFAYRTCMQIYYGILQHT